MAVDQAGNYNATGDGSGRRLRGAAVGAAVTPRRWCVPHLFAVAKPQRESLRRSSDRARQSRRSCLRADRNSCRRSRRRACRAFSSIVGDDQMAAPDGPKSCIPALFFCVGCGVSGMTYVFHATSPVAASSATTLPRNVQHGYFESAPTSSSIDETGT
jgi:hypothetical protein